jgi:hypothetical protein
MAAGNWSSRPPSGREARVGSRQGAAERHRLRGERGLLASTEAQCKPGGTVVVSSIFLLFLVYPAIAALHQ